MKSFVPQSQDHLFEVDLKAVTTPKYPIRKSWKASYTAFAPESFTAIHDIANIFTKEKNSKLLKPVKLF